MGKCDDINRFRQHVQDGSTARKRALERRAQSLPSEIQEMLAEDLWELDRISDLADQLSIVGLYRAAEINTARVLGHGFGKAAMKNASSVDNLTKFLKQKNVVLASVPHFRAIDELRLLNNAVKDDGRVTKQLSQKYRRWRQGEKLEGLDKAYERLRPKVPVYIFRLAQRLKASIQIKFARATSCGSLPSSWTIFARHFALSGANAATFRRHKARDVLLGNVFSDAHQPFVRCTELLASETVSGQIAPCQRLAKLLLTQSPTKRPSTCRGGVEKDSVT